MQYIQYNTVQYNTCNIDEHVRIVGKPATFHMHNHEPHAIVASHWKQEPYDVPLICSRHVFAEIFGSTWQRSATSVSPSFLWAPRQKTNRNNFEEAYAIIKSEY
jgi:hypothetical protein